MSSEFNVCKILFRYLPPSRAFNKWSVVILTSHSIPWQPNTTLVVPSLPSLELTMVSRVCYRPSESNIAHNCDMGKYEQTLAAILVLEMK